MTEHKWKQLELPLSGLPGVELCQECFGRGCIVCRNHGVSAKKMKECRRCYGVGTTANSRTLEFRECPDCKGKGLVDA